MRDTRGGGGGSDTKLHKEGFAKVSHDIFTKNLSLIFPFSKVIIIRLYLVKLSLVTRGGVGYGSISQNNTWGRKDPKSVKNCHILYERPLRLLRPSPQYVSV
jgi:hypothetical protein